MLATILKSKTAIDVTIAIMRAFVKMRSFALRYGKIVDKLQQIDAKVDEHDEILNDVLNVLSKLISDTEDNEIRKIGFAPDGE